MLIAHADKALAVNAALGGSIYQIITKNEADARNAISFLKRNRSGRATFLPLSVCHPRKMNEQVITIASTSPGFLGFASECVDCKEIFDPVKERLLGNVIVVDTLQNANETAKRLRYAYKIVTLDGDIVHTGGSMTGGVTKNQSTPVTMRQELETINSKIEGQKIKADNCLDETEILTQKLQKENDAIVTLQIELAKLENIYATKKAKYDSILAEYQELGVDIEENSELAQDDLVVQMSKMHAVLDSLSLEIQSLRQTRFDKGNEAEQLENQIRLVRREMSSKQSQIHNYEMEVVKIKTQLENALNRLSTDYEMTYEYPKHTLLIEATLADGQNQRRMEMVPVSRHLGDYCLAHHEDEAYCVFITTFLNNNVISDFRARRFMEYYNNAGTKYITGNENSSYTDYRSLKHY